MTMQCNKHEIREKQMYFSNIVIHNLFSMFVFSSAPPPQKKNHFGIVKRIVKIAVKFCQ